jgi:hypothetical protein
MSRTHIAGPVRVVGGPGGTEAPFFVLPFDKQGVCTGPATLSRLVAELSDATDVFVFAHGWNNDWAAATRRFDDFIADYLRVRAAHWATPNRPYRPVLVGVFWPSTALVAAWEQAPDIAGGPAPATDIEDLADGLPANEAADLLALATRGRVDRDEARRLVRLVSSRLDPDDEIDDGGDGTRGPDGLLDAWVAAEGAAAPGSSPTGRLLDEDEDDEDEDNDPATAGLEFLDPRKLFRLATVLQMKDRAGRVGSTGVADLLVRCYQAVVRDRDSTVAEAGRIHLLGHSYGAKVMLSALLAAGPTEVDSVLLLQPAISAYCFAPAGAVPGTAQPGGYHAVPERLRLPLLATFTRNDFALHSAFQWAARRRADLGEAEVAAGGPVSRYAALGGYGPQGIGAPVVDAVEPPTPYDFPAAKVIGIRADDVITGHGAVVSAAVSWMLLSQVRS